MADLKLAESRAVALATAVKPKKRMAAALLSDDSNDYLKLLLQGHSGTGKTYSIVAMLLAGEKVFVMSTDIGGNGLRSVKDELRSMGRSELLANVAYVEVSEYKDVAAFTTSPTYIDLGNGLDLWSWGATVLVWDGFSNFQASYVWENVMNLDPLSGEKAPEARMAGVQAGQVEWGQIAKSTLLQLDKFLTLRPAGRPIHKVVTTLMGDAKEDKYTGETLKGPLISGNARSNMIPSFDHVITCETLKKPGQPVSFRYRQDIGGGTVAKRRGTPIPQELLDKADMGSIWNFLTKK